MGGRQDSRTKSNSRIKFWISEERAPRLEGVLVLASFLVHILHGQRYLLCLDIHCNYFDPHLIAIIHDIGNLDFFVSNLCRAQSQVGTLARIKNTSSRGFHTWSAN